MSDGRRRRFDVVIVWRLDRFGRSLRHIVTALDELHARGIAFISLGEGIDLSTPAGRLQLHILSALAEFERARIQERIHAGIARARAQGRRLGRKPRIHPKSAAFEDVVLNFALSGREAARRLGVAAETVNRLRRVHRRQRDQQSAPAEAPAEPPLTRVL
jgi:DNA invertase Pin-like site-specific DNA recombinase